MRSTVQLFYSLQFWRKWSVKRKWEPSGSSTCTMSPVSQCNYPVANVCMYLCKLHALTLAAHSYALLTCVIGSSGGKSLLSSWSFIHCAYMKKLHHHAVPSVTWLSRSHQTHRKNLSGYKLLHVLQTHSTRVIFCSCLLCHADATV